MAAGRAKDVLVRFGYAHVSGGDYHRKVSEDAYSLQLLPLLTPISIGENSERTPSKLRQARDHVGIWDPCRLKCFEVAVKNRVRFNIIQRHPANAAIARARSRC